MQEWYSERFACFVRMTDHALKRMQEREISSDLIGELIEQGTVRKKDEYRMWIFKNFSDREDNLICAAVVKEDS